MPHFKKGPIEFYSFGRFLILGKKHSEDDNGTIKGKGKDIRVIGIEVTEWNEREGHRLKTKMVTGVFNKDIEVLIIGAGEEKALKCPKKVLKKIRQRGINLVIVARTQKACKIYNRLYHKGVKVAMLAHGTC